MSSLSTKRHLNSLFVNTAESSAVLIEDRANDITAFGPEAALALTELPDHLAVLNRTYRHLVARRALWKMPAVENWRHRTVNVFLRHDAVYVFAVHHHPHVGMANFVELRNASFVVDVMGREQTLRKTGTLPNFSTVHAYVAGEMTAIGDEIPNSSNSDSPIWHPVFYRPDRDSQFMTSLHPATVNNALSGDALSGDALSLVMQPVRNASRVRMIPGRIKVWCQQPNSVEGLDVSAMLSGADV